MGQHTSATATAAHARHDGTVAGCVECGSLAYEPGWYAALLVFSQERGLLDLSVREPAQV
jgi:hypothetical protein